MGGSARASTNKSVLYIINLIAFLDLLAVSIFLPLVNREIKKLGGSAFVMGFVSSAYGAVQLVSSPVMGHNADVYGRKRVLLLCILLAAGAYIWLGNASSLSMVLASRILAGSFKHTQTLAKVVVTDAAPFEKSYVLGNFNAFGSMGFIIGPTVGGHLVEFDNGFQTVCSVAAFIFVINGLLVYFFVSETLASIPKDQNTAKDASRLKSGNSESWRTPMRSYAVLVLLLLRFLFGFATLIPRSNLLLIMEAKYNASVISVGYLNSLQAIVATVTGFLVGPVIRKIYKEDNKKVVLHGSIAQLLSLVGLCLSPTIELAGLSLMLLSGINPFLRVGITSLSLGDETDHGAILGLGQTSTSLARMLSPLTAGIAQEILSEDGPAVLGAVSSFVGIIFILLCLPATSYVSNLY